MLIKGLAFPVCRCPSRSHVDMLSPSKILDESTLLALVAKVIKAGVPPPCIKTNSSPLHHYDSVNIPSSLHDELINIPSSIDDDTTNIPSSAHDDTTNITPSVKHDATNIPSSAHDNTINIPSLEQASVLALDDLSSVLSYFVIALNYLCKKVEMLENRLN